MQGTSPSFALPHTPLPLSCHCRSHTVGNTTGNTLCSDTLPCSTRATFNAPLSPLFNLPHLPSPLPVTTAVHPDSPPRARTSTHARLPHRAPTSTHTHKRTHLMTLPSFDYKKIPPRCERPPPLSQTAAPLRHVQYLSLPRTSPFSIRTSPVAGGVAVAIDKDAVRAPNVTGLLEVTANPPSATGPSMNQRNRPTTCTSPGNLSLSLSLSL